MSPPLKNKEPPPSINMPEVCGTVGFDRLCRILAQVGYCLVSCRRYCAVDASIGPSSKQASLVSANVEDGVVVVVEICYVKMPPLGLPVST
jgi:hypothetical protein